MVYGMEVWRRSSTERRIEELKEDLEHKRQRDVEDIIAKTPKAYIPRIESPHRIACPIVR
jgi:hypothetical protein